MSPAGARVGFLARALGCALVVGGVAALGVAVVLAVVWIERPWQLVAPAGMGAVGGLGLALGALLYLGLASRRNMAGAATLLTAFVSALVMVWVTGLAQHQLKGWPGWPFHLGFVAGIAGLVVLAVLHQLSWNERVARQMAGYRTASVGLLRPGETARVRGEVRQAGLRAPVSGKACAAWAAEVLGRVRNDWLVLGTATSGARFLLASDDGPVRVEAARALLARGSSQELLPAQALPESLRAAVQGHGFFGDCAQFNVREIRIDAGARVSVLGTVRPDGALGERRDGELLVELEPGKA